MSITPSGPQDELQISPQPVEQPELPTEGTAPEGAEFTPTEGADGSAELTVDILGEQVPVDRVLEWQQAFDNRANWERSFKAKDQRFAAIRKPLEEAFGKPMSQWGDGELASINSFGQIEGRMRRDPGFARDVTQLFTQMYEKQGATPKEAQAQAKADVQQIKEIGQAVNQPAEQPKPQPTRPQLDPQVRRLLETQGKQLQETRTLIVDQEVNRLAGSIDSSVRDMLSSVAEEFPEHHKELRDRILDGIDAAFDPMQEGDADGSKTAAILQADYEGTLQPLIESLAKQEVRRMRMLGEAVARKNGQTARGGVEPPMRGGAGQTVSDAPLTFKQMHERMQRGLGGMTP